MRTFATAAFSFCAAIFLSQYLLSMPLELGAAAACIVLAVIVLLSHANFRRRAALVMLVMLGAAAGLLWNWGYETLFAANARNMTDTSTRAFAVVTDFPVETSYGYSLDLKVRVEEKTYVKTLAYFYDDTAKNLRPGDKISFQGTFSLSSRIRDRDTDVFLSKGYFLLARNISGLELEVSPGFSVKYMHRWLARDIKQKITETFPADSVGFMQALLTGDKTLISEDEGLVSALKRTGVYHIIVVSGMHVSVLAGFIMLFTGGKKRSVFAVVPVLILFAGISGFAPSVLRAVVMQVFLLLAPLADRENDSITSISAALALILLLNPFAATGVGLQLSFVATLGIILFSPGLHGFFDSFFHKKKHGDVFRFFKNWIVSGLSSTVAASVFTMPLTVLYFGYISIIAPVVNLLILWAVTPLFCMGMTAVAFGFMLSPVGKAIAWAAAWLVRYISWLVKAASNMFLAAVYLENFALIVWFVFVYAAIALFITLKAKPRQLIIPASIAIISLCVILLMNTFISDKKNADRFSTAVLDVGQGQCIVFSGGGFTAVIDCGSVSGENAGEIAARYIYGLGLDSVDLLVLTHCHEDHAGGVAEFMAYIDVRALAMPAADGINDDTSLRENVIELAETKNLDIMYVTEDNDVTMGEITVTLFAPLGSTSENERGVCILASQDDYDVLITGDMDSVSERRLMNHAVLPDIECLVVGHHGSKYSTCEELLETISPEVALISVGENSYGHPTEETLERLYSRSITVYRTDESGDIVLTPAGEK